MIFSASVVPVAIFSHGGCSALLVVGGGCLGVVVVLCVVDVGSGVQDGLESRLLGAAAVAGLLQTGFV